MLAVGTRKSPMLDFRHPIVYNHYLFSHPRILISPKYFKIVKHLLHGNVANVYRRIILAGGNN
jgi:hypothetical protein